MTLTLSASSPAGLRLNSLTSTILGKFSNLSKNLTKHKIKKLEGDLDYSIDNKSIKEKDDEEKNRQYIIDYYVFFNFKF